MSIVADDERIAPGAFGLLVEEKSRNADGNGAEDQKPQQHGIVLEFIVASHA